MRDDGDDAGVDVGPESWDFNVLAAAESGGYGLKHIAFRIFKSEGLLDAFGIPEARFEALLTGLELLYSVENPYHCALHAADVLAATYFFRKGLPEVFDKTELLALYLAALGHDAGHFRLNNAFLKNSKHTLFKKYPESVLESFHLGLLFELLDNDDVGIMTYLNPGDLGRFKSLVTSLILATDMSKHMELFKQLQEWMSNAQAEENELSDAIAEERYEAAGGYSDEWGGGSQPHGLDGGVRDGSGSELYHFDTVSGRLSGGGESDRFGDVDSSELEARQHGHFSWVKPAIEKASEDDRRLVMQMLLKCADLGNVVRPLEIADTWGKRIMEEFYQQGEKELALGLPLTTFPNRRNFDYVFARHQNGFLVNVVRPLFEIFTKLTDPHTREAVISSAAENGDAWTLRENANKPKSLAAKASADVKSPSGGKAGDRASPGASKQQQPSTQNLSPLTHPRLARKHTGVQRSSRLTQHQTTMGWIKAFKQSNLTMLTYNAMEVTGLDVPLAEDYGAGDEARAIVRSMIPYIPRLELTRLAAMGLMGPQNARVTRASSAGSSGDVGLARSSLARSSLARSSVPRSISMRSSIGRCSSLLSPIESAGQFNSTSMSPVESAGVESAREFDSAVVVARFDGFLELCERVLATGKGDGSGKSLSLNDSSQAAAVIAAAVNGCLSKAVDSVHAAGGDVVRMGYEGLVCVFPLSGKDEQLSDTTRVQEKQRLSDAAGAVLRAAKCAFTLVSQLSSSTPELASLSGGGDADGQGQSAASRAHLWPGLRKYSLGLRVMVVENLQLSRMTVRRLLDHFGCMTHFAENASQAAAACANMEFDVILVDLMLTDLDGYEVARHVRKHGGPVNSQAYICALTAVEQPELLDQCLRAGMNEVTEKPANMDSLQATFRKVRELQRSAKRLGMRGVGGGVDRAGVSSTHLTAAAALREIGRRRVPSVPPRGRLTSLRRNSISGSNALRRAAEEEQNGERCVPVSLPRYADMLMSASACRAAGIIGSQDDSVVGTSTLGRGGRGGAMSRFFASLCGGGRAGGAAHADSFDNIGALRPLQSQSGNSSSTAWRSTMNSDASERGNKRGSKPSKLCALAKYKEKSLSPDKGLQTNVEEDLLEDLATMDDLEHEENGAMPVCITVTASVGFGKMSLIRVVTSASSAFDNAKRWGNQRNSTDGDGDMVDAFIEGQEARETIINAARDEIIAADVPRGVQPAAAAAAAAAFGPAEGGPFQQVAALTRLATTGDVVLSPVAWRLIAAHCEGDTPPRLRGGARLNRLHVHEVVPPLTDHPLAPNSMATIIPRTPDPLLTLRVLSGLIARPLRVALMEVSLRTAASLEVQRNAKENPPVLGDEAKEKIAPVPTIMPKTVDAVIVVLCLPGPSSAVRGRCVVVDNTLAFANMLTTAVSCITELLLRFPGAALTRVTSDVLFRRNVDTCTGGCGGGGEGLVMYASFGMHNKSLDSSQQTNANPGSASASAVAFALAALASMVHLGHSSASLGVAMGKVVTMPAGMQQRCEWGMIGGAIARAERLAEAADAEVLCDLRVSRVVGNLIDFDPVPHASGDDTARARNLTPGALDAILQRAAGNSRGRDDGTSAGVFGHSSAMGRIEIEERGKAPGNGLASGGCVLMPADTLGKYGPGTREREARTPGRSFRRNAGLGVITSGVSEQGPSRGGSWKASSPRLLREQSTELGMGSGARDRVISPPTPGPAFASSAILDYQSRNGKNANATANANADGDQVCTRGADCDNLPAAAVVALSAAAAACAAAETLSRAANAASSLANLPVISCDGSLLAARRVVADAQEAMAPRLLYIEGAPHSGKSRVASAVLDMPEVRRLWLIRVRGMNGETIAGGGGATDTRALSSFIRVFHQLLGFAKETSSRERKNAIVELLERCGSGMERFGRYAKPILELLELEEPEVYPVLPNRMHVRNSNGGACDGSLSPSSDWLGNTIPAHSTTPSNRTSIAEDGDGVTASIRPNAAVLGLAARRNSCTSPGTPGANKEPPTDQEHDTPGGPDSFRMSAPEALFTTRSSSEGAANFAATMAGDGFGSDAERFRAAAAKAAQTRSSTYISSMRSISDAGAGALFHTGLGTFQSSIYYDHQARQASDAANRLTVLDGASVAAVNDACKFLSPSATAALLDDGFGHTYIPLSDLSHVDQDTGKPTGSNAVDVMSSMRDIGASVGAGKQAQYVIDGRGPMDNGMEERVSDMKMCAIAGRLASAVAFTRQRNGVQRRDHNRRFRACLHRRKNTLANLLLSVDGISRLCTALALMLQRLLLGRSVQAAPAQPSLPGWLLLVENSERLDALSMGLVRACLEHCSIPMVVLMCHQRETNHSAATTSPSASLSMRIGSLPSTNSSGSVGSEAASDEGSVPSASSVHKAAEAVIPDDVWGAQLYSEIARSQTLAAAAAARVDLRWMLEQPTSTSISMTPLSQSDTRTLVEHRAASILLAPVNKLPHQPSSETGGGGRGRTGTNGGDDEGSDGDGDLAFNGGRQFSDTQPGDGETSTSELATAEATDTDIDCRSSGTGAVLTVGLPSSLHASVFAQTMGNPLYAALVTDLLVASGAISVATSNRGGVCEVTVRQGSTQGLLSAARITGMPFKEVILKTFDILLPEDAKVALRALTACGDSFSAAHACEVVQLQLAGVARDKAAVVPLPPAQCPLHHPGGHHPGGHHPGVQAGGGVSERCLSDAYKFAPQATEALGHLITLGLLSAEWGSTEDAFGAALIAAEEARQEFINIGGGVPLQMPKCLDNFVGSPRGGVGNRGRLARVSSLCFTNSSIRQVIYGATPLRERRAVHLAAVQVLRHEATHAEESLVDPATAALLYERAVYHLSVVQNMDRVAVAVFAPRGRSVRGTPLAGAGISLDVGTLLDPTGTGAIGTAGIGAAGIGARALRVSGLGFGSGARGGDDSNYGSIGRGGGGFIGSSHSSNEDVGLVASETEILAAVMGLAMRVQCAEDATRAHLQRGNMRLALTSITSAGVAAATWVDFSAPLKRTFGRTHPALISASVISNDDSRTLMVRNAAWALLAHRITLDIGDCYPPLLLLTLVDAEAPLRNLRRALYSLHRKWPFLGVNIKGHAAEEKLSVALREMFVQAPGGDASAGAQGRREGDGGREGDGASDSYAGIGGCFSSGRVLQRLISSGPAMSLEHALRRSVDVIRSTPDDVANASLRRQLRQSTGTRRTSLEFVDGRQVSAEVLSGDDDGDMAKPASSSRQKSDNKRRHHGQQSRRGGHEGDAANFLLMSEMKAGIGDVLEYAGQIKKGLPKTTRHWALDELTLEAMSDLSTVAVFAGRQGVAAQAILAHAKAFCDAPSPDPHDAALLLNTAALLCLPTQRARLLGRAKEIVQTELTRLERLQRPSSVVKAKDASGTEVIASVSARLVLTSVKRHVHFVNKRPPPRGGPAILNRALALCCQGDWVTARSSAASAVVLLESGWGNARLCDLGRCLGATADAHLGYWETSLAAVTALSHDRSRHAEIGPWCLALRMAANTAMRHPEIAVKLWKEALQHAPFHSLGLHPEAHSAFLSQPEPKDAAESGYLSEALRAVAARDMPVLVACRAFATQALWCSGAHAEAVTMAEQVCSQLMALHSPMHCLLPSAALAVGETVARACHVGALQRKPGRWMLMECHAFLGLRAPRLLPFSAALAAQLIDVAPQGYL